MASFIARQPNGLYCRFSTITDCPTNWNMTEQDYIELCKKKAEEEAKDTLKNYLAKFENVKDKFRPNNMTEKEFEQFLKEVSEPYKPKQNIPIDDKCPKCGSDKISVQLDGGYQETRFNFCPDCGQPINWNN